MRKSILYPVLAAALGALAAGLRMWQRTAGYDESGLPVPFALSAIVLAVFLLLCAGAMLVPALRQNKTLEDQPSALPRGQTAGALLTAAGILLLAGGVLNLKVCADSYLQFTNTMYVSLEEERDALRAILTANLLPGLAALASVPTAAALLYRAKLAKSGGEKPVPFSVMMVPIFCWLWLIEVYRQHTSNPILWDYVLLLLAVTALLVSAYERAGFAFGAGKPRRTLFTSPLALMLSIAALPDCGGAANAMTLIALALHTAVELISLLSALEYVPRRLAGDEIVLDSKEDAPHEQG